MNAIVIRIERVTERQIMDIVYFYGSLDVGRILTSNRDFSTLKRFVIAPASQTFITDLFPSPPSPHFLLFSLSKSHERKEERYTRNPSFSLVFFSFSLSFPPSLPFLKIRQPDLYFPRGKNRGKCEVARDEMCTKPFVKCDILGREKNRVIQIRASSNARFHETSFFRRSGTTKIKNKRSTYSKRKEKEEKQTRTLTIFYLIRPNSPLEKTSTKQCFVLFFERNERNQRD